MTRALMAALGRLIEPQSICSSTGLQLTSPSGVRQLSTSLCTSLLKHPMYYEPGQSCHSVLVMRGLGPQPSSRLSQGSVQAQGLSSVAAQSISADTAIPTDATQTSLAEPNETGSNGEATTSGRPHTTPTQRNWDWQWVLGDAQSRKPAIKRPQRHQWHYCNPTYDPNQPLPTKMLPPHAPPAVEAQDEWRLFRQVRDQHRVLHPSAKDTTPEGYRLSHRRIKHHFLRWVRLREIDWKRAFQQGVAEDTKSLRASRRLEEERSRQQAWQQYREQVFRAALQPPAGAGGAPAELKP